MCMSPNHRWVVKVTGNCTNACSLDQKAGTVKTGRAVQALHSEWPYVGSMYKVCSAVDTLGVMVPGYQLDNWSDKCYFATSDGSLRRSKLVSYCLCHCKTKQD